MKSIETERLSLLEITPEVYQELFRSKSEAELRELMGYETDEEWAVELQRYQQGRTGYNRSFATFLMRERSLNKTIGHCGFHSWYVPHSRAEIGYAMSGDAWKQKGYMKEALAAIVRYGFETMQLNRIEAFIGPSNIASQKLVRALGFTQEGIMREHYCKNGVIEDSMIFSLLRKEFE